MPSIFNCVYRSCACNKNPHSLDWNFSEEDSQLICYGACNVIHLYKYEECFGSSHFQSLLGHTKLVTSVHWITGSDKDSGLISTSADCTAIIWTKVNDQFHKSAVLVGHSNVVRNASGIYLPSIGEKKILVATLSADSSLKVWEFSNKTVDCIQTISFGHGFCFDVKFIFLKNSDLLMLVGGDDAKIHIYNSSNYTLFNWVLSLDGHEDWIQCLDVIHKDENTIMLASASQDCYIRIWKISPLNSAESTVPLKVTEAAFNASNGCVYSVSLESILSGHENWIYSVKWYKQKNRSLIKLLSTSMDKTIVIWEMDPDTCIWIEKVRVGEVGGNTLGFLGGVFSPCGRIIVAHGFQGAIHIWKLDQEVDVWKPGLTFGGHHAPVLDIDWDPSGEYLISCSQDQTTRIHAHAPNSQDTWFEIARPQVHGYDMVCLTVLSPSMFASAGDEKVIRIFQAPKTFAENLKNLSNVDISSSITFNLADSANVPSLGLSNKAVFKTEVHGENGFDQGDGGKNPEDSCYAPFELKAPPTEETLLQSTLWPEVQKLYGHPYEVFTITSNHSKTLIASACKASKPNHAAILLWDTLSWKQVGQLVFHSLTVTQMEFSPDDEYLLSVSRDRMWAIYKHFTDKSPSYQFLTNLEKKNNIHTRIIWSCSWSFDSLYFATASRDKKVAVWEKSEEESIKFSLSSKPLEVEDSATAVSFAPCLTYNNKYIVAVGLENGCIVLSSWCKLNGFICLYQLDNNDAHHLIVNKLKFSPTRGCAGNKHNTSDIMQLASGSSDHHVKIYNIFISALS